MTELREHPRPHSSTLSDRDCLLLKSQLYWQKTSSLYVLFFYTRHANNTENKIRVLSKAKILNDPRLNMGTIFTLLIVPEQWLC